MTRSLLAALCLPLAVLLAVCPQGVLVRKEYRDLSTDEWGRFRDALLMMQKTPSPDGEKYSLWDYYALIHVTHGPKHHGNNLFLPWHRMLVSSFEQRIQAIQPNVTIPYWDWAHDWKRAVDSPIFKPDFKLDIKSDDPQGDCRFPRHFPSPHCLKRTYDAKAFPQFPTADYVQLVIQSHPRDYEAFGQLVEHSTHNQVHKAFQGDINTWASPNDPIFWLFHAMVDKIWADWQERNPDTAYNRTLLGTELVPFGLRVADVINTEDLCYRYQAFSKAKPYTVRMV